MTEHYFGPVVFDGVDDITPRLYFDGTPSESIRPDDVLRRVEHYLRTGAGAWDPYD